jgi:uncharacterized repeat protein (TIGR01451 family)
VAIGTIRSSVVGVSTLTATDSTDGIVLAARPQVFFTQGQAIELRKSANKNKAVVGDVVNYLIEIKNRTANIITPVRVDDQIPPNFKYVKGSARLNGSAMNDPAGNRPLTFDIGAVPAFADSNGNGRADPGEPGYMTLSYQLVIGSGASPREYVNTAAAKDVCDQCFISNPSEATVTVTLDPLIDLGTIIGKVFEDNNRDGWQDKDEPGVAGAMVALDNGTYVLTDEHGRYHFPAVDPGHRLVKLNISSISSEAAATTDEAVVVLVTPGILAKVNFGVIAPSGTERIGRDKQLGISLNSEDRKKPLQLIGSAETLTILMNGETTTLPTADVQMAVEGLNEVVEINGGKLDAPVRFTVALAERRQVETWQLTVFDAQGAVVRILRGKGAPPETVLWDGRTDEKDLVKGGSIYQYQFVAQYADGSKATGPRVLFGVNQTTAIAVRLSGSAFKTGSDVLSEQAKTTLAKAAAILRKFPQEKIVIEGHTDETGTDRQNLELSKKRAEAALAYLVNVEGLPRDRFTVQWYGSAKPMAGNRHDEGRTLNRRIEIRGEVHEIDRAKLLDEYRAEPVVTISGSSLQLDPLGRFSAQVEPDARGQVEIEMANSRGGSVKTKMTIPQLEIIRPKGESLLAYGEMSEQYRVRALSQGQQGTPEETAVEYEFLGRTDAGNAVELDGKTVAIEPDGTFRSQLKLKLGNNTYGILVRNPSGYTRAANLLITATDRDDKGGVVVAVKPIPNLVVKFPRPGAPLKGNLLTLSGLTDKGNMIQVNGQEVMVQPDGQFAHSVKLEKGTNHVVVQATDPEGYEGTIEREFTIEDPPVFFLAFADGVVGRMSGKGYLEGAGMDKSTEYYSEGRAAYYFKGMVAGKYLITSAFDTGTNDYNKMFKNLDNAEHDRLLTNLDPDKLYPVYGDSSTIVYDAQSQGKFYLAVDSDEFHLLVGNYPLALADTELARYQATLYGVRAAYQSVSRSKYGKADTEIILFGAEASQAHVRDELLATGGSLYYLSHHDVIEGSEQVTLVVRDKNTGLLVARIPQQQNVDYTVKYPEGRILFSRPILSVAQDTSLINQAMLPGNPVSIQVDYEVRTDFFEKTAAGGRVRQQVGDHVSIGSTYVKDELGTGQYELKAVDTEVRLGKNTRILGEYAESTGTDSVSYVSTDGGLTYTEVTPAGLQEGKAWKASAELDIGELFGTPDQYQAGGYIKKLESGFLSNGNFAEKGTEKTGVNTKLQITPEDKLLARFDREQVDTITAGAAQQSETGAVQYAHKKEWWEVAAEYQTFKSWDPAGMVLNDTSLGAVRLTVTPYESLSLYAQRQETMSGAENDQTTLGIRYRILPSLSLEASGMKGTLGDSAQVGLNLNQGKTSVYVAERLNDDRAGQTTSTIFGTQYQFAPSSKVYSEYQWERSDGEQGNRTISLVGAQRQWDLTKGVTFLLAGEEANLHAASGDTSRSSLAAGLSVLHPAGVKFSTRDEIRRETGALRREQFLTVNQVDVKLDPDFTLIGKYRYSLTRDLIHDTIEAKFDERSIGLAYRPVENDRFNALARYTRLLDQRPVSPGQTETTTGLSNVTSLEWSLQLNRSVEWVEKLAYNIKAEGTDSMPAVTTHTSLIITRFNLALGKMIDLGTEYRVLAQREADDQRAGWLTELMWKPSKYIRFGVGYNFTDFSDNEFSHNNYSVRGWFVRLQGKY